MTDSQYSIKDMERLSGIKAHTIRIWEKRYDLLNPERTDSNIRLYSNHDLRKIINVASLVDGGMKISRVSELTDDQISHLIENQATRTDGDYNTKAHIDGMVSAMVGMDEALFEKVFGTCILRYGMEGTFAKVIYPFLVRVGMLWATSKIIPAHEHFITQLVKRKIFCGIDGLIPNQEDSKRYLLFLPETESHELGLLMADYILRSHGHLTWNLGQAVPFSNLIPTYNLLKPDVMVTFMVLSSNAEERDHWLKELSDTFPDTTIMVAIHESSKKLPELDNVRYLYSMDDLTDSVN